MATVPASDTTQRMRRALQAANVGLWEWDLLTNAVHFSPEWKQQLGYADHELESTHEEWRSRVHPEDLDRVTAARRATIAGLQSAFRSEYRLRHRDGSYRWISSQSSVVIENGKAVRVLGAHFDITDRKVAEGNLEDANRRLRAVIDSMLAFVGVFSPDGVVLEANRFPLEAAALKREDVIGKSFFDSFWFSHSDTVRAQVRQLFARAARGQTVREDLYIRLTPSEFATVDGTFTPVLDERGRVICIAGFGIDISQRKAAEDSALESEQLRRLIIDTEPECVKVLGPDGKLVQMNPAGLAMLQCDSFEQARTRPLVEFVAAPHRAAFAELHRKVMAGGSGALEFEVVGLKGRRRWLETRAVPLRKDGGPVTGLLGVTRDVTEQKLQQERIARLSRTRAVMSSVNALIVRARSRAELFQEACRIAVEQGGFGLAWIGLIGEDASITSVASHGRDGGHLATLKFSLHEPDPVACMPTVRAIRDVLPAICNDIATDETVGPWREPLRALGYNSFVSCPLVAGGQVRGCLNLYAAEAGFFDPEEMKLLGELANDLAFALEFIIKDETLDFLSIYDPLTRLPNRNLFMRRLPGFIQSAQDSGLRLAVVILDVERFKAINDAAGQAGGDEVLKLTGERLKFHAGGSNYVARIAGDRFAAVIPNLDRDADIDALIQGEAWDRIEPPFQHGGQEFAVSFKLGIAVYPQDGGDAEALLRNAELALKHAKTAGRRHARYTAEMGELATSRLQLGRELRRAFDRGELLLYYQPRVDLRTGHICGAEALLRWDSPTRGLVQPASIIPLMEESGLIVDVGHWVLERALLQRERWRAEGFAVPPTSVNVSAMQLREPAFAASVKALLARSPWAASGLEVEVTESAAMADPDLSVATLRAVRELGVSISLDDFGTGYSSLAYLNLLPLNAVKIDRTFIAGMAGSADTVNIVSSIIALAHSMNLKVIAEGVETEEQLRVLRLLRCDEIQGFLFSPPVTADEYAALLHSGKKLA